MTAQASFTLRARNPDVLTCIANLSSDEVFTPPELANRILDTLAEAWATDNGGADIWTDKRVRFLDPSVKSGVFLREITARLVMGLEREIPSLEKRVEHILTKQVFGIAMTRLTGLIARRSVYCSKHARGKHSIAKSFAANDDGNIWFQRTEHGWVGDKCSYCGANKRDYDRGEGLETHAYAFIHTDNTQARLNELFGGDMQFDVIIGNPPYQLGQSGGDAVGNFAMPIYQKFIGAAKGLGPRYVSMITPSRWFAGGRGLESFRQEMLSDRRLRCLIDYPDSREVFAGVDIAGGVSYFLWDASWKGKCRVTTMSGGTARATLNRYLNEYDILVRYNEAIPILERILKTKEGSEFESLAKQVSPIQPFSIRTSFRGAPSSQGFADPVQIYQKGGTAFIERENIPRNVEWVDQWKVFLSRAASEHGGQTDKNGTKRVFSRIIVGGPGTACTETYLVVGRFRTKTEAVNFSAFLRTRLVRFLVSLRTNTQDLYNERFSFVPNLPMEREWTDEDLYKKFGITKDEIAFINRTIRPMSKDDE